MKSITVNFPSITAKEIYKKAPELFRDIGWYKNEDFFTKEKTRAGKKEVDLELKHKGKSWNEIDELKGELDFLNFAEVMYLVWKLPKFRKTIKENYTRTSSRRSDGDLVYVGDFESDGVYVYWYRPGRSDSDLGVSFSRGLDNFNFEEFEPLKIESIEIIEVKIGDKYYRLVEKTNPLSTS